MRAARLAVVVPAVVLVAAGVAAAGGTTLRVSASPTALAFSKKQLTAKPGTVTIVMANPSPLPHNVAVKGAGVRVKGKVVLKGGVSRVTVRLKRGRYVFYCSVPGHEAAGMRGTLIVK